MIFRLGELFCGPGGLACGAKMAGSVVAHGEEYAIRHAWANDYSVRYCLHGQCNFPMEYKSINRALCLCA